MPVDHGPCLLGTFEGVAGLRALLRVQADGGALGVRLMGVQMIKWMCRGLPWPLQWGPGAGGRRETMESAIKVVAERPRTRRPLSATSAMSSRAQQRAQLWSGRLRVTRNVF